MLSVLIPIYNLQVDKLIDSIVSQGRRLAVPFEVLLGDDASEADCATSIDALVGRYEECRVVRLSENKGAAFLRNRLADESRYPFLLYLDADVFPKDRLLLATYLHASGQADVICGGFCYEEGTNDLRHKYGRSVESQSSQVRQRRPYERFCSMNFFIRRDVMLAIRFDESFHVGYEDCDFGRRLAKNGTSVLHIDNKVIHCIQESSEAYLAKMRRAIDNLRSHEERLYDYVRLVRWHREVQRFRLERLLAILYKYLGSTIEKQLIKKNPSLNLFAFYKLLYLCGS